MMVRSTKFKKTKLGTEMRNTQGIKEEKSA